MKEVKPGLRWWWHKLRGKRYWRVIITYKNGEQYQTSLHTHNFCVSYCGDRLTDARVDSVYIEYNPIEGRRIEAEERARTTIKEFIGEDSDSGK